MTASVLVNDAPNNKNMIWLFMRKCKLQDVDHSARDGEAQQY